MSQGCFQSKRTLEDERRPGEVARAVTRAKQGDQAAIRYLYTRYAGNVYGYARSIVRNDHDAEDVVQQVFTRMMTAIQSYEQRSVPFSAWLLRITHNMAIDYVRRRTPIGRRARAPVAEDARSSSPTSSAGSCTKRSPSFPRFSARSSCSGTLAATPPARSPSGSAVRRIPSTDCITAVAGRCSARSRRPARRLARSLRSRKASRPGSHRKFRLTAAFFRREDRSPDTQGADRRGDIDDSNPSCRRDTDRRCGARDRGRQIERRRLKALLERSSFDIVSIADDVNALLDHAVRPLEAVVFAGGPELLARGGPVELLAALRPEWAIVVVSECG